MISSTRALLLASGLMASLLLAAPAHAVIVTLEAQMECGKANAGLGTCAAGGSGTGNAILTFDTDTRTLDWEVDWVGLSGITTVAHFHGPANPNQNAGVQVNFLTLGGGLNPSIGRVTISDTQAMDLLMGKWYVNIHSSTFGAGEIRGQLQRVPAAVPLAALALAVIAMLALPRRRGAPKPG